MIRVLSLGAGVQSSTVLLMSIEGDLPRLDRAIFADTGWEPDDVYRHLDWLTGISESAGIPVDRVDNGDLRRDALDPDHRFASMPLFVSNPDGTRGMLRRQCTSEYKLKPIHRRQRELVGLAPRQRAPKGAVLMESWQGISWDETQRMRDAAHPWQRNVYPLVDLRMTRRDCLDWCEDHGYPIPPRSACLGCPFHADAEWLHIREHDPAGWADAVDFDHAIRNGRLTPARDPLLGQAYLHHSRRPLAEAILRPEDAGQLGFDLECEGLCGF